MRSKPCGGRLYHAMSYQIIPIPIFISIFIVSCEHQAGAQMKHRAILIKARIFMG